MTELAHKLIMLKPMQTGVSGYARLQEERGRILVQVNLRGLACKGARVFWYCSGGEVSELGTAPTNPRGEACLSAEAPWNRVAPERLQALLVVEDSPSPGPLLIGLCASQSAGSLLDAKNASLSLCEKLIRRRQPAQDGKPAQALWPAQNARQAESGSPAGGAKAAGSVNPAQAPPAVQRNPAARPAPVWTEAAAHKQKEPSGSFSGRQTAYPSSIDPPREIFLPAIDPSPYIPASGKEKVAALEPGAGCEKSAVPVGRLKPLRWPQPFAPLQLYFRRLMPCAIFDLPGWRFVCVSQQGDGLWIGYQQRDGVVCRVAYAMRGEPEAEDDRPYQRKRGLDGQLYRILVQRADGVPSQ